MAAEERACNVADLGANRMAKFVASSGAVLAVGCVDRGGAREPFAVSGLCAHKQGELWQGDIEDADGVLSVRCPRHQKKMNGGLYYNTGQSGTH